MSSSPPRIVTLVLLTALTVLTLNMFLPALPAMRAFFGVDEAAAGWRAVFVTYAALGAALLAWCWWDLGETHATGRGQRLEIGALLKARHFWAYVGVQGFGVGVFYVFLTGAPFVAADAFGLGPAQTGIALGSTTLGFMAGAALSARLMEQVGPLRLILVGRLVPLVGLGTALAYYAGGGALVWPLFLSTISVGIANGLSLPGASAGALSVRPDLAGSASGFAGALSLGLGACLTWAATAVIAAQTTAAALLVLMIGISVIALVAAGLAWRWQTPEDGLSNA